MKKKKFRIVRGENGYNVEERAFFTWCGVPGGYNISLMGAENLVKRLASAGKVISVKTVTSP